MPIRLEVLVMGAANSQIASMPQAGQLLTAAGMSPNINPGASPILLRNKGDAVYVRVNLAADTTAASATDARSLLLKAEDEFAFVAADNNAQLKFSVAAA